MYSLRLVLVPWLLLALIAGCAGSPAVGGRSVQASRPEIVGELLVRLSEALDQMSIPKPIGDFAGDSESIESFRLAYERAYLRGLLGHLLLSAPSGQAASRQGWRAGQTDGFAALDALCQEMGLSSALDLIPTK